MVNLGKGISLEIIRTPEKFSSLILIKESLEFINSIIEEEALILTDKKKSFEEEKDWYENNLKKFKENALVVVVILKGKKIIGFCDARKRSFRETHNVDFGIAVRKEYRGRGYGKLLLETAIKEAKTHLKARNLWISYVEGNNIAKNLYEKLGFGELCRLRGYVRVGKEYRDRIIMKYKND